MTILDEIAARLPDNQAELITPAILRQVLTDMVTDYIAVASANVSGLAPIASPNFTGSPSIAGGPLTINPTASTTNQGLVVNQTLPSGSQSSGPYAGNQFTITNNGYISTQGGFSTTSGLLNALSVGERLDYLAAGTGAGTGPILIGRLTAAVATSRGQQLIGEHASAAYNLNSAGEDCIWGFSSYAYVGPSANLSQAWASDHQSGIRSGAVVAARGGISLVSIGDGSATTIDAAMVISSQQSPYAATPVPFTNGITLWTPGGTQPIKSSGSFINANAALTLANFISLPSATITGKIFDFGSGVFQMTGTGAVTLGDIITVTKSINTSFQGLTVANSNSGSGAFAVSAFSNDVSAGSVGIASSGVAGIFGGRVFINALSATSGIAINNAGANPTVFGTSSTEVARIQNGLQVGTTTRDASGVINAGTGFNIAGAATSGHFLRGNGTNFVDAAIALGDLPTLPYFSASLSANQSPITNSTFTKVNCNTVLVDTNSFYDNATNFRFQPTIAGKYQVRGVVQGLGTSISEVDSEIRKNGTTYARGLNLASGVATTSIVEITVSFNGSTDYVELWGNITGTGTLSFLGGTAPIRTWFEARYMGP